MLTGAKNRPIVSCSLSVLWSLRFLDASGSTCTHVRGHWLQNLCYTSQIWYSLIVKSARPARGPTGGLNSPFRSFRILSHAKYDQSG
ncbi:hypothetical protein BJY01DRAFT_207332 [Aspergillus pseudoustus]|uniref:Secreted protein n=1 Tax=Aspergillus pseudoustus TaxID=1810923 RepID=A0ABR4KKT8_9EURO